MANPSIKYCFLSYNDSDLIGATPDISIAQDAAAQIAAENYKNVFLEVVYADHSKEVVRFLPGREGQKVPDPEGRIRRPFTGTAKDINEMNEKFSMHLAKVKLSRAFADDLKTDLREIIQMAGDCKTPQDEMIFENRTRDHSTMAQICECMQTDYTTDDAAIKNKHNDIMCEKMALCMLASSDLELTRLQRILYAIEKADISFYLPTREAIGDSIRSISVKYSPKVSEQFVHPTFHSILENAEDRRTEQSTLPNASSRSSMEPAPLGR